MTNPDAVESKAQQAATGIANHALQLWLAAHQDGIRNGIEVAATLASDAAKRIAEDYSLDAVVRETSVYFNEFRDMLRFTALQLPEPDPRAFGVTDE